MRQMVLLSVIGGWGMTATNFTITITSKVCIFYIDTLMPFKKYNWVLYNVTCGNMQLNLDAEYF